MFKYVKINKLVEKELPEKNNAEKLKIIEELIKLIEDLINKGYICPMCKKTPCVCGGSSAAASNSVSQSSSSKKKKEEIIEVIYDVWEEYKLIHIKDGKNLKKNLNQVQ